MLNRLLPKSQCKKAYFFVNPNRNLCGLINRINRPNVNYELLSNILLNKRSFGKKIQVYNQPAVGEGTVEVDIIEWLIKPGDNIKPLQTIGRGKYEKADVDILAPAYGGSVHKILVNAGEIALVGKPLVEFEIEDEDDDDDNEIGNNDKIDNTDTTIISSSLSKNDNKNILALPATKHLAKEHNIDLSVVVGTGKDGRILKEDVMRYMNTDTKQSEEFDQQSIDNTNTNIETKPIPKQQPILHALKADKIEKIFGVKKAMVKKMTEANSVPLFGYSDEIIMNHLVELRKNIKDNLGIKITYLPFILKATSLSLLNPLSTCLNGYVNNIFEPTELIHKGSHNIGIAIDTPNGLIVPNIKCIEQKSILEINNDLNELINRSKNGQITNDDITGGTFTLSNIGAIGGTYCSPICFVPEVCIGALGTINKLPRYNINNDIYNASVMTVSWSADHRVIDGATVARFSNDFKKYLENPSSMLLHLK